jgi:regulator of protease activity HflC (stomatin/prohibitin superfamily)
MGFEITALVLIIIAVAVVVNGVKVVPQQNAWVVERTAARSRRG